MKIALKTKQEQRKLQDQVNNVLKRNYSSSSEEDFPLLEMRKKMKEVEKELDQLKAGNKKEKERNVQPELIENLQHESVADGESQLLGSNYEEMMISISNNIFCRKLIYDMTLGSSHKPTHIARKMLEGVFKTDVLLRATLTGQSPRAQGKLLQQQSVIALDIIARNAIVDFATKYGTERVWEHQTIEKIERSMSQRIGEMKRKNNI